MMTEGTTTDNVIWHLEKLLTEALPEETELKIKRLIVYLKDLNYIMENANELVTLLPSAFSWARTDEGFEYWESVSQKLFRISQIGH